MQPGIPMARTALTVLLPMLLAACADTPSAPPGRVAYPRGEAPPDVSVEDPNPTQLPPLEPADESLFEPVRRAIADADWIAATLALPARNGSATRGEGADGAVTVVSHNIPAADDATALWIDYYGGRIALLRGDLRHHGEIMATLRSRPLPPDLEREMLLHQLEVAERRGDAPSQLRLAWRLLAMGGHCGRPPSTCEAAIWRAAQQLAASGLAPAGDAANGDLQGWLELADAAQRDRASDVATAVTAWLDTHPSHPATPLATSLQAAAGRDTASTQLALVLPLSGPLAAAGDAVTRGFLAAHFARADAEVGIEVLDGRRFESTSEWMQAARNSQAAVIVGPLGKLQVGEVLAGAAPDIPVLALNRPETPASAPMVLQLSLAPEDEALQLAEHAFAAGSRRALLIRPADAWGDRIETALRSRWEALGGHMPAKATYSAPTGYSNSIRDALALDASARRAAAVRSLFSTGIETSGRRRADLDAVFLLTRNAEEARALKPLLDYHYAGDLPVYALSTADGGGRDRGRDRDLEGLRLLVMPWRLQSGAVPGLGPGDDAGSFDALHALGADAYALARRWWQLRSAAAPAIAGLTADLHSDVSGVLQRRLRLAEFAGGVLRPL